MTYRKIAQLAGVSLSTVSKALSGNGEISEETAKRIWKIAEENGVARPVYRKNRSSRRITILVPEIVSVYYSTFATEITNELRKSGIEPTIHICGFQEDTYLELLTKLEEEGLTDGILLLSDILYPRMPHIPTVQYTGRLCTDCDTIYYNLESGVLEAVQYFKALGHTKIGFVGEKHTMEKLQFFRSAMEQLAMPLDVSFLYVSDKRFEKIGEEAAKYYLHLPIKPTALLCAYDEVALGAMYVFQENGVRIPRDLSIIGMNDIPSASYATAPLTTIATYSPEMVHQSILMLLDHINRKENHIMQNIHINCRLIVRNTTARVPKQRKQSMPPKDPIPSQKSTQKKGTLS